MSMAGELGAESGWGRKHKNALRRLGVCFKLLCSSRVYAAASRPGRTADGHSTPRGWPADPLSSIPRSRRYGAEDKVTTPQQSPPTPCKGWGIVSLSGSGHDQGLIRDPFLQVFYGFIARKRKSRKVLLQIAKPWRPLISESPLWPVWCLWIEERSRTYRGTFTRTKPSWDPRQLREL